MNVKVAPDDCMAEDRVWEKSAPDKRKPEVFVSDALGAAESSIHDKDMHSNERNPSAMHTNEWDGHEMRADVRLSSTTWQTRAIAHEPQWQFGLLAGIFAFHLLLLVLALTVFASNLSDKTEPPAPLEMVTVDMIPPPTLEIGDPNADPLLSTTLDKTRPVSSAMASPRAVKTPAQQPAPPLRSASMPQTPRVPAPAEKMPTSAPAEKNQSLPSAAAAVSSVGSAPLAASSAHSERPLTASSSASSGGSSASSSTSNASGGSASGGDAGSAQSASGGEGTSTSPPRYGVAYLNNPPPKYPTASRRMGEQGRVVLRVFVSASGAAKEVRLQRSCGYDALDEAAMAAVRKWRFVPAKKGGSSVEAWVNVPIVFTLD